MSPLLLALTFAVTAVVIACPDALGLATPTAVVVATDLAAKRGVLSRRGRSSKPPGSGRSSSDRTGTLTEGKPRVTDIMTEGLTEDEVLRLAAAAEARSSHPLAGAVLAELERRGLGSDLVVEDFENIPGHGVRAGQWKARPGGCAAPARPLRRAAQPAGARG